MRISKLEIICSAIGVIVVVALICLMTRYADMDSEYTLLNWSSGEPFKLLVEPSSLQEKQYDDDSSEKIAMKFSLVINPERDIRQLEVNGREIMISRANMTIDTPVAGPLNWDSRVEDDGRLLYASYADNLAGAKPMMEANGYFLSCKDCFVGKDKPYYVTFNVMYLEEDGTQKVFPARVVIPLR